MCDYTYHSSCSVLVFEEGSACVIILTIRAVQYWSLRKVRHVILTIRAVQYWSLRTMRHVHLHVDTPPLSIIH